MIELLGAIVVVGIVAALSALGAIGYERARSVERLKEAVEFARRDERRKLAAGARKIGSEVARVKGSPVGEAVGAVCDSVALMLEDEPEPPRERPPDYRIQYEYDDRPFPERAST